MADVSSISFNLQKSARFQAMEQFYIQAQVFFSISEYQVIRCLVLHYQNRLYLKANEDKVK